ncbi:AraC family transcriptional regulator [Faecalicatena sp. AGMB00832]|uniref:AraC family transcriptional regulator n=1 Tax=Faecalicatena faecalis TaxID=2726362 RepID=A0ABS6D6N8_9FIRM|nr:GyrI-like domain-containing protein [Faecalicatena faecalis]MBU3877267.1 AraC family transcriptional regulator [Faecalicatena faecalis]
MDKYQLVNESIDYIMQHLDEDLSLESVAAQFFISKYHFSRIFKAVTGESVYAFVKRCKVDQSAVDMKLNPKKAITDIGLDYGYSSSNYSSVFKKHHDVSPTEFRHSIPTTDMEVPFPPKRTAYFKTAEEYDARIEIQELPDFLVIYERFIGSYVELEKHWYQFLDLYQSYLQKGTILVERYFHDPAITDPSQCICDICMTVEEDCDLDNLMRIKGGRWIVYHFDGEIQDIFETLQGIFNVWLPQSGYHMARSYGLNIYHHIERENHRVVMDLCIPIV